MIAALIIYALATSCLVALAGLAAEHVARARGWPVRGIWLGALLLIVGLTALAPARRGSEASAPMNATSNTAGATGLLVLEFAAAGDRLPTRARDGLLTLWIVASAAWLALFVVVQLHYATLRRRWPRHAIGEATVRVAPRAGPAVMGVLRPEIIVPQWLLGRTSSEQRIVVQHEAEHVQARDPVLLTAAWLVTAAMPWNAFVWWIASRLRLAVELDCDARMLRGGTSPSTYGNLLIDVAAGHSGLGFATPSLLERSNDLKTRLIAMHPSSRRPGLTRTGAALAVGIVSIVAACQTELPPSPRGAARPVSDLSLATAPETTITYTIDGIPVTREQLDAGRGRGRMVRTRTTVEQGSMRGSGFAEVRNESGMLVGSIDSLIAVVPPTLDGDGSESGHIRLTVGAVAKIDASAFQGLLIVDGKRMDARSFASINERSIAMIELMSGPLATKTYADAAAGKGLILVTTRK